MYKSIKIPENLPEIFQSHLFTDNTFSISIVENIADGHLANEIPTMTLKEHSVFNLSRCR